MNETIERQSASSARRWDDLTRRRKRVRTPQHAYSGYTAECDYDNDDNDDDQSTSDSSVAMDQVLLAKMQAPLLRGDLEDDPEVVDDDQDEIAMIEDGVVILVVENGPLASRKEWLRNRLVCDDNNVSNEIASACRPAITTALQEGPETYATDPETPPPAH